MIYVSGLHALNLSCKLNTTGDWHSSSMDWNNMAVFDSDKSVWGDYGIEKERRIPYRVGIWAIANHIRACLDLIYVGDFPNLEGMRNDYICTEEYDEEIFNKVLVLSNLKQWEEIDGFMEREYLLKWVVFRNRCLGTEINVKETAQACSMTDINKLFESGEIDSFCRESVMAYFRAGEIGKLYDLCRAVCKYADNQLCLSTLNLIKDVLSYRKEDYLCYAMATQRSAGTDKKELENLYKEMCGILGIRQEPILSGLAEKKYGQ